MEPQVSPVPHCRVATLNGSLSKPETALVVQERPPTGLNSRRTRTWLCIWRQLRPRTMIELQQVPDKMDREMDQLSRKQGRDGRAFGTGVKLPLEMPSSHIRAQDCSPGSFPCNPASCSDTAQEMLAPMLESLPLPWKTQSSWLQSAPPPRVSGGVNKWIENPSLSFLRLSPSLKLNENNALNEKVKNAEVGKHSNSVRHLWMGTRARKG